MDELIKQHGTAIIYILTATIALLGSVLAFFLKVDRKQFKELITDNKRGIESLRKEQNDEINYVKGEIDEVRQNYNNKFDRVYEKQDDIKKDVNSNHKELMTAINQLAIKVAKIDK